MTKAISVRLDTEILDFIHNDIGVANTSDAIRGVLLWVKLYRSHYLDSVKDYISTRTTHES